jgi:hypothetical protein
MTMRRFETIARPLKWLAAMLVVAVAAGCGGGDGGNDSPGDPVKALAPTVSGTVNANGATNVPINAKVGATFSEAMDPASITAATFFLMQGTAAVPGTVSYTGVSAVFVPSGNLAPNTLHTVTVKGGSGGARDLAGNAMTSDFSWSWTTGAGSDVVPPKVSATIPANGATNIPVNTKVGATFSEAMDPLAIDAATFVLTQGTATVAGTVGYSGVSAVFIPSGNLAPATRYTVTIKGGAGGAKDLAGNALVLDYSWTWTTSAAADTIAPAVVGTINADGATGVALNTKVGATFSEAMDPLSVTVKTYFLSQGTTTVPGTVSYSGVSAVFIPYVNLLPGTLYTVTIKGGALGVTDLAGNAMAGDRVLSWTTGAALDTGAPTVVSTTIANGATNVPISQVVAATFSEGMDPLSITNVNCTLTATVSGTQIDSWTVRYSGTTVEFRPDRDDFGPLPPDVLLSGTAYTVTIKGGAGGVLDLAGNPMAGDFTFSFVTAPATL